MYHHWQCKLTNNQPRRGEVRDQEQILLRGAVSCVGSRGRCNFPFIIKCGGILSRWLQGGGNSVSDKGGELSNDSSNKITVIWGRFSLDYFPHNRFGGRFGGRFGDRSTTNRGRENNLANRSRFLDSTGGLGTDLHKVGFRLTFFPVAIWIGNVGNSDQGTKWIYIAVLTSYNVVLSTFLVSNVGLGLFISNLVFIIIRWIGLKVDRDFFIKLTLRKIYSLKKLDTTFGLRWGK